MNCDICNILEYYGDPRTLSQLIKNPFWQELTDGRRYYHKKLRSSCGRIPGITSENFRVHISKAPYFKIQVFSPSPLKKITKEVAQWVSKFICYIKYKGFKNIPRREIKHEYLKYMNALISWNFILINSIPSSIFCYSDEWTYQPMTIGLIIVFPFYSPLCLWLTSQPNNFFSGYFFLR